MRRKVALYFEALTPTTASRPKENLETSQKYDRLRVIVLYRLSLLSPPKLHARDDAE